MSDLEDHFSSPSISTPGSSECSTPFPSSKRKCIEVNGTPFKLPHFSPEVTSCIGKDSFYTTSVRNKLIKEGCNALRGHCWGEERAVTNYDKRNLAIRLYELAPKSLGDCTSGAKPEVSDMLCVCVGRVCVGRGIKFCFIVLILFWYYTRLAYMGK